MKWLVGIIDSRDVNLSKLREIKDRAPGVQQSVGLERVGHDWASSLSIFHFHALEQEMAIHSSVLAWRIPGTGEPGGLPSMWSHRVRQD